MDTAQRRATLTRLFGIAVSAVDPEPLTQRAIGTTGPGTVTLIAIGKAAPAMCRGAARVLGDVTGICVTNTPSEIPVGVALVVGDHPVPAERSFLAGQHVLEVAAGSQGRIIALVSGGGSALCEFPIEGVSHRYVTDVNWSLLRSGASIDDMNLVRRHLSAIKGGGLTRFANTPIETFAISDVCGGDPSVIASGPTIPQPHDPDAALEVMAKLGIDVPQQVRDAIEGDSDRYPAAGPVTVLADGHTAATALVEAARSEGLSSRSVDGWVQGDVTEALDAFLEDSGPELTVATGEPDVPVAGEGAGGRNTHAALIAATCLAGSESVFGAFATDGVDGNSDSAGAIVDGSTVERGGDPTGALARCDSAAYLEQTGDLLRTGPTGTNVSDLWVLWR